MNINILRGQIQASFCSCAQCESRIDEWPDADASEPGQKSIFNARLQRFVGLCPNGHMNEWLLSDVISGELQPKDVTFRTLGKFVPQSECSHEKKMNADIPEGSAIPSADGLIEGPAFIAMCLACGQRRRRSGILKP